MAEYIERSETAEFFEKSKQTMWHKDDVAATISSKKNIPAADVVEVVHGEWKFNKDGSGTCNQCHITQKNVWDYDNWQNYCGHCGAKMDGEKND
jgi:hypothetical protein